MSGRSVERYTGEHSLIKDEAGAVLVCPLLLAYSGIEESAVYFNLLLQFHFFAVAFWLGVVAVELLLERTRTQSPAHGFTVARLHRLIDLFIEMPAFTLVLISGLCLIEPARLDGIYALKIVAGCLAVLGNMVCLVPVMKRHAAAERGDLGSVTHQSRVIDIISILAVPVGGIALFCGVYLATQR